MNFLLLLLLFASSVYGGVRYDDYVVYRVIPRTENDIVLLRLIEEEHTNCSFWSETSDVDVPVDIMVSPAHQENFHNLMEREHVEHEIYINNVQELIDATTPRSRATGFDWNDYHTLNQIYDWMKELATEHPEVTLIKGGSSYEGRDILGVHVSFKPENANRSVFLEGGIHAREWISPAVVTYILNELISSTNPDVRRVATTHDWYIFPNFNPDGYVYTFKWNRLWRKTRKPNLLCRGSDANRNWGWRWRDGGSSANPCSDTYAGSSAFSEVETKTMSNFITSISDKLLGYIAFHAYSQLLLIPYGDQTSGKAENYEELKEIGDKAARSLSTRYGTNYTVGNIVDVIYVASGGSMDWVKGNHKTRITYTYELRDTGKYGFLLPKEQIIPTGEETLDSLVTILTEFDKKN